MVREARHVPDGSRYESPVDDIVGNPNSTEMPNISPDTKKQPTSAAVDSVVDHYEALMHRLIADHATDFTEVGITMSQAKVLYVVMAAGELRIDQPSAAHRHPARSPGDHLAPRDPHVVETVTG